MRNPQKDLEAINMLRQKKWFSNSKGNMDLVDMCEYWINKTIELEKTIEDMCNPCSVKFTDCL